MKKLILISALLLVASNGWAYNETDLAKLKATNACEGCDLSGVNLRKANLTDAILARTDLRKTNFTDANLGYANFTGVYLNGMDFGKANLSDAKLDGAIYCKTQMPWGELNDHCED